MIAPGIGVPSKLHWLPVAADEVSTTDPPKLQNVVGPSAVMVGVDGVGLTVTTVANDALLLQPAPFVVITV